MSTIHRILPHFYGITPLGEAEFHFMAMDDSVELPSLFHVFQCETKESWWWPQPYVRMAASISGMRDGAYSPIMLSDEMFDTLLPHILRHKDSPFYARATTLMETSLG